MFDNKIVCIKKLSANPGLIPDIEVGEEWYITTVFIKTKDGKHYINPVSIEEINEYFRTADQLRIDKIDTLTK